jgi:cytochrome P450
LDDRVGAAPITAEGLRQLPYLDAVVSESLRLWPPGIAAGRQALQSIDVAGIRIEPGTLVMYYPNVTHRLPEAWPEPLEFRPERWLREAPGYVEPPPLAFLPFGAGPRRCIGFAFALTEIKVLLSEVVRRLDLELVSSADPGRAGLASMRPKHGVRVRVRAVRESPAPALSE